MRFGVVRNDQLVSLGIILFIFCRYFDHLPLLNYYDELVSVFSSVYVVLLFILRRMDRRDQIIVLLLSAITVIGLISNIFSNLISVTFAILIDIVWLWKTFATFLAFKYLCLTRNRTTGVISNLYPLAILGVWVTIFLSVISQLINTGLTKDVVIFGLKFFALFDYNAIQTGWFLFSCVAIICANDVPDRKKLRYIIVATIPLILTFSSLVTCWLLCVYALLFFMSDTRVLKKRYIVGLGAGVVSLCFAEVQKYLLSDSVRSAMIKYSIVTANRYFPLGSGFATFGSEMAHRYYSKLYIEYGFNNRWGLSQENDYYMNDNFIATIIGQYGWIALLLYVCIVYIIFTQVNTVRLDKYTRIVAIAIVITMAAAMIASGTPKSMMGAFQFAVLGIISAKAYEDT